MVPNRKSGDMANGKKLKKVKRKRVRRRASAGDDVPDTGPVVAAGGVDGDGADPRGANPAGEARWARKSAASGSGGPAAAVADERASQWEHDAQPPRESPAPSLETPQKRPRLQWGKRILKETASEPQAPADVDPEKHAATIVQQQLQQHFDGQAPCTDGDPATQAAVKQFSEGILNGASAAQSSAGTRSSSASHQEWMSDELKEMKECLSSGGVFDLRESIGRAWGQALVDSPDLKRKYALVGKKHAQQRAFRAKWLKKVTAAKERQESQWRAEVDEDTDTLRGVYKSFWKSWTDEGGGPGAFGVVAEMWRRSAAAMIRGETWKGKPFIKWHPYKGVVQCIDIEEEVTTAHKRNRGRNKEWKNEVEDEDEEEEEDEGEEPKSKTTIPRITVGRKQGKGERKAVTRRIGGKQSAKGPPQALGSEPHVGEGGAPEEVKGDVSESLKAIAPALRSVNEALSMSSNVVKSIEDAEEDWARFNHPTALNPVKTARSALEVALGTI